MKFSTLPNLKLKDTEVIFYLFLSNLVFLLFHQISKTISTPLND